MNYRPTTKRSGFTLLEMGIVLIILSLLVGGALAGRTLIHSMRLKKVATEAREYSTALAAFKEKYNALPGDMENATNFWGAANADFDTCAALTTPSALTSTATCNGDGDKRITQRGTDDPVMASSTDEEYEGFRAWQHLANAELISGKYTGVQGSGGVAHAVPGQNVPSSNAIDRAGWTLTFLPYLPDDATVGGATQCATFAVTASYDREYCYFTAPGTNGTDDRFWMNISYRNVFLFGGPSTDNITYEGILAPLDAEHIDSKFDDGTPLGGKLIATGNVDCTVADGNTDMAYNIADETTHCALIFITGE